MGYPVNPVSARPLLVMARLKASAVVHVLPVPASDGQSLREQALTALCGLRISPGEDADLLQDFIGTPCGLCVAHIAEAIATLTAFG